MKVWTQSKSDFKTVTYLYVQFTVDWHLVLEDDRRGKLGFDLHVENIKDGKNSLQEQMH